MKSPAEFAGDLGDTVHTGAVFAPRDACIRSVRARPFKSAARIYKSVSGNYRA